MLYGKTRSNRGAVLHVNFLRIIIRCAEGIWFARKKASLVQEANNLEQLLLQFGDWMDLCFFVDLGAPNVTRLIRALVQNPKTQTAEFKVKPMERERFPGNVANFQNARSRARRVIENLFTHPLFEQFKITSQQFTADAKKLVNRDAVHEFTDAIEKQFLREKNSIWAGMQGFSECPDPDAPIVERQTHRIPDIEDVRV